MFKITNNIENKVLLETSNGTKFIKFTQKIFVENGDTEIMQIPATTLGCKNYLNEYCDNLILEIL